jgi:hypothetical protein
MTLLDARLTVWPELVRRDAVAPSGCWDAVASSGCWTRGIESGFTEGPGTAGSGTLGTGAVGSRTRRSCAKGFAPERLRAGWLRAAKFLWTAEGSVARRPVPRGPGTARGSWPVETLRWARTELAWSVTSAFKRLWTWRWRPVSPRPVGLRPVRTGTVRAGTVRPIAGRASRGRASCTGASKTTTPWAVKAAICTTIGTTVCSTI